jgi:hypothetical protein
VGSYIARGVTFGAGRNAEANRDHKRVQQCGSGAGLIYLSTAGCSGSFGNEEARMGLTRSSNWRGSGRSSGARSRVVRPHSSRFPETNSLGRGSGSGRS